MRRSTFRGLTALMLTLALLLALTGCSVVRDVAELADALIESAAITNSDEPLPVQPQILPLVPETDAPTEAEAEAAQPPLEEAAAQSASEEQQTQDELYADTPELEAPAVLLDSAYTGRDDVALYIHLYNRLPPNFITKTEAREFGWQGGSLEGIDGIPSGSCIGGDRFGNNEGILPRAQGRSYFECDIDTQYASSRGAKRIVFSNDGLIYYTEDHYESFELLYGEE